MEEKRKLNEIELKLSHFESDSTGSPIELYSDLTEIEKKFDELFKLADRENKSRREDFRRRIQHLRNIHTHIKKSLDNVVKRSFPNYVHLQRSKLFEGADLEGGTYSQTEIDVTNSLNRSSSMIDSYLESGQLTLSELLNQKERLKSVHRKVIDILNYLGLSNSTMRSVENRDAFDRILVYSGMILILLLLFFIWLYRRK